MKIWGVVLLTAGLASAFNPFHRRQAVASDVAGADSSAVSGSADSSQGGLDISSLLSNSSGAGSAGLGGIFSCANIDPSSIDIISSLGNVAQLLDVSSFVDVNALEELAAEQQLMMLMLMEQLLQLESLDFINSEEIVSLMQESLLVPSFTTIDFVTIIKRKVDNISAEFRKKFKRDMQLRRRVKKRQDLSSCPGLVAADGSSSVASSSSAADVAPPASDSSSAADPAASASTASAPSSADGTQDQDPAAVASDDTDFTK